ncbi:hypothetical protein [Bacillus infantis]|uniref:hypothetical protein n=1 Tax=Bacillus infantis TaxID=324767 RepID=UPI00209D8446|nr:hypothetical protein [Bacillus infantis]MCP1160734.1 hypothetical protein [Bacillus infantis]
MKKKSPYKLMLINMLVFTLILVNIVLWPKIFLKLNPEVEHAEVPVSGSNAGKDQRSVERSSEGESSTEEEADSTGGQEKDEDIFKIVEIK